MNLRGGQPLWPLLSDPALTCPALVANEKCDCLVVGSGITGALTAFHLAEEGAEVVLIDRRGVARGSTPASTALLQYDIDVPLLELRRRVGSDAADLAYRRSRRALDEIAELALRLRLDCDLVTRPSLYLAHSPQAADDLQKETQARAGIGLEVDFLGAGELKRFFGMDRPGAILSRVALQIDPWRFTCQILRAARELGARIYAETELRISSPPIRTSELRTTGGHRIDAKNIIFATGYEAPEQFTAISELCELNSTFVVATRPIDESRLWPKCALLWETADPYLYARTAAGRIIIGGEDEPFQDAPLRDSLIPAKTQILLQKFRSIFPIGEVELETAWAGTFAQTKDGLPFIGELKAYPHCQFALGYGGNGITFSLIAAKILRDGIFNRIDPEAAVFSFDRRKD